MVKQKIIKFFNCLFILCLIIFIILTPYSKKIVKICFLAAVFFGILIQILELRENFKKSLFANSLVIQQLLFFFIALILSTILSIDSYYSQGILLERFLPYFTFFFLGSYAVQNKKNTLILIQSVILSGIVLGFGGIFDFFYFRPERLFTSFGHTVSLAEFFVIQIPLSYILLVFSKNKLLRLGGFLSLTFLLPCLIMNSTRAAWVAVIISILIVSLIKKKKKTFIFLLVSMVVFLFLPLNVSQRAMTTLDPTLWGERLALWKIAIRMFVNYPLFGVGLGMQEKLFSLYWQPIWPYLEFKYWHVHNNYLEIAAESGIVGLTAFIGLCVVFLNNIYIKLNRLEGEEAILLLGLFFSSISVLIFAMSASNITVGVQETTLVWFLFGMASGFKVLSENKEKIA